uniref:Snurportin-1 n=1 Tax=Panagrolaimus sp. ES5 TaxID=591445 RepID=A0AC34GQ26_9BILA
MDELVDLMNTSSSLNDYAATERHPRFDNYKNVAKIASSQNERRAEHRERQRSRRNDAYDRQRPMLEDDDGEDDVESIIGTSMEAEETANPFQLQRKAAICKRYKDQLMLSEWLIDIPNELHGSWTVVASPKGKRCLVIAKDGITKVYSKHGFCLDQFKSGIPGGGAAGHGKTILDCIRHPKNKKQFYILDLIYANMMSFCEVEAVIRLNQLEALAEEIIINSKRIRGGKTPIFTVPPRCPCNVEEMAKMMAEPMSFDLDGLLYYSNDGWYTPGYTPLVGWLEPWMLPEVLNVPIHESYKAKENSLPLKEYVEDYNDKHNHHYVHGRPWEKKKPEESTKEEKNDEQIVVD